ncbi:magnesium transporter [Bacteroidales bacterium OttesenSCG-928-K03]|nr:magnesium transporter [Odoribacter sp. OttesenSCG-928-L07]MDL2239954.1 magnesium transporter [Bacteroidales bacterium OttesenSCG-928-L14]MDL2240427.1 magnesium transporter [Bacteroidales bacterium OttesenSCG-928-K22]MDL2242994.1 magnesium transporter [Bacteroidales bacterium OttesenSCG-928-K03]
MNEITIHLKSLIEQKDWKNLKNQIHELSPLQISEIIEEMSKSDGILLFRLLSRQYAKETFENLSHDTQEEIINGLAQNGTKITSLLNDLEPDDRTAFFEELPGKVVQPLMQLLSEHERKIAGQLLAYPEDSVGRLMTPEYVAVKSYYTVNQALDHIRKYGHDSETLNIIYVVDDQWNLIDDIRIKEIILASPEQKISEITDNKFTALNVFDDQENAVKIFLDQDRVAMPVIDNEGTLVGIVTFDDMMDVAEEESTEDFQKFGSIKEAIVNPLKAKVSTLYKNRVVWLTALVFVNIFSGAAISNFEDVIQSAVSLVFFLPLLIGSGGNAGSQSATLMIRALATGDVVIKDWFKLIGKELIVSLILGLTMAAGVALIASFRAPEIILVVSLTMVLTVITGSLIGLILPFIFTKFKVDPATASAPLITSISDITGVLIYFSIASVYLGI